MNINQAGNIVMADLGIRALALLIIASIIWASASLFAEKCSSSAKVIWFLVILSVPILGPLFYYIRFKT
jgi:hypothetical protein